MKKKQIKNSAASVRAKLLNKAKQLNLDYNRMLLLYLQERFLYRLSQSQFKDLFILKGGILFYGAFKENGRTTKDIDLLATNVANKESIILKCIQLILSIKTDDGVEFLLNSVKTEKITRDMAYKGIRVKFKAKLDTAIIPLQIDFGFYDRVFPHPIFFEYPCLLQDQSIEILAYSWDSVIAEKLETIIKLGQLNSRMKDFYDIFFLQQQQDFKGTDLQLALSETFKHRKTDIAIFDEIFSESFFNDKNKQRQWNAFLQKLENRPSPSFYQVISAIKVFLKPVVRSIIEVNQLNAKWDCNLQKWINE